MPRSPLGRADPESRNISFVEVLELGSDQREEGGQIIRRDLATHEPEYRLGLQLETVPNYLSDGVLYAP